MGLIELIKEPWHWSVGGTMIALVMFLLIFSGQKFGVSSSFRDICTMSGLGKAYDYFNYDWKKQSWLLLLVIGAVIGGYIASHHMSNGNPVQTVPATVMVLESMGVHAPSVMEQGSGYMPEEIFGTSKLTNVKFLLFFIVGGLFIGFGTRYAGGCTSGHAITGLSNFQMPSLVAVIGFFAGGLLMTHLIFPTLLSWLI